MFFKQKKRIETIFKETLINLLNLNIDDQQADLPVLHFERPKQIAHGDLACNIAMQLGKRLNENPRQLATRFIELAEKHPDASQLIEKMAVAGPGFINIWLHAQLQQSIVPEVLKMAAAYGKSERLAGKRIMFEFVSANPTGPLHVGHGRQAALGDSLANLFASQGADVYREFYYNDSGVQINNLAHSVQARLKGLAPGHPDWPEASYAGEYIVEVAQAYASLKTVAALDGLPVTGSQDFNDLDLIRRFAIAYLRREQDQDLKALGIYFDNYFLESSLYQTGKVSEVVNTIHQCGYSYEKENALWLNSQTFGDDKDRVMRKSDGTYTYFVPDLAYHVNKWQRGFSRVINIQGSDHHSTITRVRAGLQAMKLGIPKDYPDYVLHKMVRVMRNGAEVKISKRAGSYITISDLINWSSGINDNQIDKTEIDPKQLERGRDAVRFFLTSRKADTEFTFDIDLAIKQSDDNPVYYVQYAHARICSILETWGGDIQNLLNVDLSALNDKNATLLLKCIVDFPETVAHATTELAPHHIAFYARDLASTFHSFYNANRVLVDDLSVKYARLSLLAATRQVLVNALELLGVSAPVKM